MLKSPEKLGALLMFKQNTSQSTIGEHLIYQNLLEGILSRIIELIDWKPLEEILAPCTPPRSHV